MLYEVITAILTILISLGSFVLFFFNRRLQREIDTRRQAELVLQQNERALQNYSKQIEQYSLSAASILSIRDEPGSVVAWKGWAALHRARMQAWTGNGSAADLAVV